MRALFVILLLIGAVGFVIGCGSETTEVAWENASSDDLVIHQIVWERDNIEWTNTSGYTVGAKTGAKEVNTLDSTVECSVLDGDNFNAVQIVSITGAKNSSGNAVSLFEGESNNLRLSAAE